MNGDKEYNLISFKKELERLCILHGIKIEAATFKMEDFVFTIDENDQIQDG